MARIFAGDAPDEIRKDPLGELFIHPSSQQTFYSALTIAGAVGTGNTQIGKKKKKSNLQ